MIWNPAIRRQLDDFWPEYPELLPHPGALASVSGGYYSVGPRCLFARRLCEKFFIKWAVGPPVCGISLIFLVDVVLGFIPLALSLFLLRWQVYLF